MVFTIADRNAGRINVNHKKYFVGFFQKKPSWSLRADFSKSCAASPSQSNVRFLSICGRFEKNFGKVCAPPGLDELKGLFTEPPLHGRNMINRTHQWLRASSDVINTPLAAGVEIVTDLNAISLTILIHHTEKYASGRSLDSLNRSTIWTQKRF